jgi:hypothetical protein
MVHEVGECGGASSMLSWRPTNRELYVLGILLSSLIFFGIGDRCGNAFSFRSLHLIDASPLGHFLFVVISSVFCAYPVFFHLFWTVRSVGATAFPYRSIVLGVLLLAMQIYGYHVIWLEEGGGGANVMVSNAINISFLVLFVSSNISILFVLIMCAVRRRVFGKYNVTIYHWLLFLPLFAYPESVSRTFLAVVKSIIVRA